MKKEKFDIQGMTCSSCSSHVEKAVNKLDGIKCVNVNFLSNNMIVEYDEKSLNSEKIERAVIDAGYGASLVSDIKKNNKSTKEDKMKNRLIISIIFLIPLMYIAMNHMLYDWFKIPIPEIIKNLFHGSSNAIIFAVTQFLLLLPIIYVNRNYFIIGFNRLFKRTPNMDSLIAIGSSAATIYGIFAIYMIGYGLGHNNIDIVNRYSMDIYFESAGTILTLITVGKYLETKSKGKTSEAISKLINLAPKTAIVIRDEKEIQVELEEIVKGDTIAIKPGASIPVDGVILNGNSSVDESSITGESMPVYKNPGDNVISGTINKNGYFRMKATKVGDDTTLSQIIKLVEEASNSKAPIAKIADKVSSVFVPTVIIISIITAIIWIILGQSFEFALTTAIAVLVISCPCALGLATPVAIMVGTGKGAENGILIKSAESLELLHSIDTIVLDKTGTITEGKPKVIDIITSQNLLGNTSNLNSSRVKVVSNVNYTNKLENNLLKIAGSLEKNSEHPLAEAILEKVNENNIELLEVTDFLSVSGRGVQGKIDGVNYIGGNLAFMKENNIELEVVKNQTEKLAKEGKTLLYFAKGNNLIGIITVADRVKTTSKQAIEELKNKNLEVIMLTGDNKLAAETIGKSVGINNIISDVLPQDKEKEVSKLQAQGKKVAFVGDGINDSPALVKSDVGLAIGSGTDIAIESADIVLMKDDLLDVDTAISLSKAVIRNIKMNLFWAFIYNIIGIPVAAGVFYLKFGLKLNPMIGAAAMSLSSVCVVTNALRLRYFKSKRNNIKLENSINTKNEISKTNISKKEKSSIKDESFKENLNSKMEELKMKTIMIEGMQCNHCKMSVEKALNSIEGIEKVEVDLEGKKATIETSKEIENTKIKEVIEEAGFEVIEIKL